jgi:hypothetical protein
MTAVVIGVDPHKRSNTALVLDPQENVLAKQRFPERPRRLPAAQTVRPAVA